MEQESSYSRVFSIDCFLLLNTPPISTDLSVADG